MLRVAGGGVVNRRCKPSKHEIFTQCCVDVGPPSSTSAQRQRNIGSMSRVFWEVRLTLIQSRLNVGPSSLTLIIRDLHQGSLYRCVLSDEHTADDDAALYFVMSSHCLSEPRPHSHLSLNCSRLKQRGVVITGLLLLLNMDKERGLAGYTTHSS